MKNPRMFFLLFAVLSMMQIGQAQEVESLYIEWGGEDEIANAMVSRGIGHLLNVEFDKSITFFEAAVDKDPALFAPHVIISMFSEGGKKAAHQAKAQELVTGKNEASRLFVSLLDTEDGTAGDPARAAIWANIYNVAPDGRLVHFYYGQTRENPDDKISELEKLLAKNEKDKYATGYIHNILGYIHQGQGDTDKAKMHFDTYLEQYPEGYNAYDSMGEYYLLAGDLEKAKANYQQAVEKYAGASNARQQIEKIDGMMSEEGNLIMITTEHVAPEHMMDYRKWGSEFKIIADKTGFNTFWVSSSGGSFSYASLAGKTMADLGAHQKEWSSWYEAHPELGEQYEKYSHSVSHTTRELWRHSPKVTYQPTAYVEPAQPTYVRLFQGFVKYGHEEQVNELLAEFKAEWEAKGISQPYSVYWNVFGTEGSCVGIRSVYSNIEAWSADRKEIDEKIGEEKMMELMGRWSQHMRHWKVVENFPVPEMTHIKEVEVAANN